MEGTVIDSKAGGHIQEVKSRANEIATILNETAVDEPFRASEIDMRQGKRHGVLIHLRQMGAINVARDERYKKGESTRKRHVYRWNARARHEIETILDDRTTFPRCEHTVHIYNSPDTPDDKLECKYCGEVYDKSTVRELL